MNRKQTMKDILEHELPYAKFRLATKSLEASRMAKRAQRSGDAEAGKVLYAAKKRAALQRFIAGTAIRTAGDHPHYFSLGNGKTKHHLHRVHCVLDADVARATMGAVAETDSIRKRLRRGIPPSRARLGSVYDQIDIMKGTHDTRLVEQRLRHCVGYAASQLYSPATIEAGLALAKLRRMRRKNDEFPTVQGLRSRLRWAIARTADAIADRDVTLPVLYFLYAAMEPWPWPTAKMLRYARLLQTISRKARIEKNYAEAAVALAEIGEAFFPSPGSEVTPAPVIYPPSGKATADLVIRPQVCPTLAPQTPPSPTPANAKRVLAWLKLNASNRCELAADQIGIIAEHRGKVLIPRVATLPGNRAEVDILFDVEHERLEEIEYLAREGGETVAHVNLLDVLQPALVSLQVDHHQAITHEVTARLAALGCDLLVSLPATLPAGRPQTRPQVSFTTLLSRPTGLKLSAIARVLEPIARRHGGTMLITANVTEAILANRLEPTAIARRFPSRRRAGSATSLSVGDQTSPVRRVSVVADNRIGFFSDCVQCFAHADVSTCCPVSWVNSDDQAVLDVLLQVTDQEAMEVQDRLRRAVGSNAQIMCYTIDQEHPLAFVLSVTDHDQLTYNVTRALGASRCDLKFLAAGLIPQIDPTTDQFQFQYSLTGWMSRPKHTSAAEIKKMLSRIANDRQGAAYIGRTYSGLFGGARA